MENERFLLLAARELSGEASNEERQELSQLFAQDLFYKERFNLLESYWQKENMSVTDTDTAFGKLLAEIDAQTTATDAPQISVIRKKRVDSFGVIRYSKTAAIFILCISCVYFIYRSIKNDSSPVVSSNLDWQVKQIPKGARSTLILPDGSKVILNADSKLQFPKAFSGDTREVYLIGEGFFDVAHNAKMPFIIHTGKMNIKVLGTEFNVKSYPEDSSYETTLIHGSIEVTLQDRPSDKIILKPKEKLIVSNTAAAQSTPVGHSTAHSQLVVTNLHYVSQADSTVVETSWLKNKMIFQDESFENLALEISRRYGVDIRFENNKVKAYRFTGIFENETIEEMLDALKLTEKFNYKVEDSTAYIF